jgi:hypothetical protein
MTTKTEWLDWLEASADRLQERYRQAWTRLPLASQGRPEHADRRETASKPWSTIQPHIDRETREVVVHLELPQPHTVEADVRVIGATLAIAVLRCGSGIERAPTKDCYRRAIPLPPKVDPASAVHQVDGHELVIRMRQNGAKRRSSRSAASRSKAAMGTIEVGSGDQDMPSVAQGQASGAKAKAAPQRRAKRISGTTGQVTELPVGTARRNDRGGASD